MNEDSLSLLIQNVPAGIVLYDAQGKIIFANSTAEKLFGLSFEKLMGLDNNNSDWSVIRENGESLPIAEFPSNQVFLTKKIVNSIIIGIPTSVKNNITWILVNGVPVFNEIEQISEVILSFIDISELKRAEQKLKKELIFQNDEKEKRAEELKIANKELIFQNDEKEKRAEELKVANKELLFQNHEKEKRAEELNVANKELIFQNDEKEKRAEELKIANKELLFQNDEKEKRAEELKIANKELIFQNDEKEKRAQELIIANDERRETNDYLENLINYANAPIIVWNTQYEITRFNKAFENLTGRIEKEIMGKSLGILFPYDSKDSSMELIRKTLEGERLEVVEINIQHIDSSVRTLLWNSATIMSPDGKTPVATIAQGHDITGRKIAEEKIGGLKNELEDSIKELLFQNDEKEKRAEELGIANIELAFQDEEKEKRAEELKIANFDIIEGKKVEAALENAKKVAEDANKMKSVFLANMSHEIRTPLNAIVGFSSILKEKSQDNKVNTEYLDNIIKSSKVLLNIINDILDLSKVEAGRIVIDLQPVNLNNLIKEIQSIFQMKASDNGITLNIKISDNIPGSIITDEKLLRQILFNLIGNAVKFTHIGSVEIVVDIIPKNEENSKIDLLISIKDSGIGIPSNQLTTIFEPFTQISHKSSNKYGGTGLGLSITKRFTELLGGTISVTSEYGKGSVFIVSLFNIEIGSLNINDDSNIDKNWLLKLRFKNPILLIAEDVLTNRQVIKGYLEALNITIIETENGEDCISAARKNRPDIILMDMQMPVMDGYTAISILKSDKELKHIPIIALTASGMKHEKDKFGSLANDFLLKPIYKYELVEILTKYLPYDQQIDEKPDNPYKIISIPIISTEELPMEIKDELIKKFLSTIKKLQKTLNFDDLISLGKDLEMFTLKHNITIDYCSQLNDNIASFNTDKISSTLLQLTNFINK